MKDLKIIVHGRRFDLVHNPIQQQMFFVPKEWGLLEEEVVQLPINYHYGGLYGSFVMVDGLIYKGHAIPEKGYIFETDGSKFRFKDDFYPVAVGYREVNPELAAGKLYPTNEWIGGWYNNNLPAYKDSALTKVAESLGDKVHHMISNYHVFGKEANEIFSDAYNKRIEEIKEAYAKWELRALSDAPSEVWGVKVVGAHLNPNDTTTYILEDEGRIHERDIYDYTDEDLPSHVEKVKFTGYGEPKFLYEGKWYDSLDEIILDDDIQF